MAWISFAVISAIAAGATAIFAKLGLEEVPSHLGNAVRTGFVLVLSLIVMWWSGEHTKAASLTGRGAFFLLLSGVATAVSWVAYFKALSLGSATSVTAIDKASLAVTALLAAFFLGESLKWRVSVGVGLIIAGALLISTDR